MYNLARAFRPKTFADIIGQAATVQILKNIINNNIMQPAYLLVGTRGVGKTTIARIIAKALNCDHVIDGDPCGSCDICLSIEQGSFIDCIEIDAASNNGVDNIREIIDNSHFVASHGKYKVYIIDEVHMLSKSAFNAMLKTLEEPPAHTIFILATTESNKIPITILSRCLQLSLHNLSVTEIYQHIINILKERQIDFELDAIDLIANKAGGSMRDALSITDRACAYSNNNITLKSIQEILDITDNSHINTLLTLLIKNQGKELILYAYQLINNNANIADIMLQLSALLAKIQQIKLGIINGSEQELNFDNNISHQNIQLYFEICSICLEQINKSINKNEIFIMCLLRMLTFHYNQHHMDDNNFNSLDITNKNTDTIKQNINIEEKKDPIVQEIIHNFIC